MDRQGAKDAKRARDGETAGGTDGCHGLSPATIRIVFLLLTGYYEHLVIKCDICNADGERMAGSSLQLHRPLEIARQLAERVRVERLRHGWKQSTLADRSGVSLPTIRRYERTGRTSVENLFRLCHALGRLDEFAELLRPPAATSLAELELRTAPPAGRKRGTR